MPCIPASPPRLPSLGARTAPRPPHARWKQISLCLATCRACLSLPHGCPATVSVSLPSCSVFGSRSVPLDQQSTARRAAARRPLGAGGPASWAHASGGPIYTQFSHGRRWKRSGGSPEECMPRPCCHAGAERPSCCASPPPAAFFSFLGARQPRLDRAARIPGLRQQASYSLGSASCHKRVRSSAAS